MRLIHSLVSAARAFSGADMLRGRVVGASAEHSAMQPHLEPAPKLGGRLESAAGPEVRYDGRFDSAATENDIRGCFRLLLGRNPHREELQGHFSRVGEDLNSVVGSYLTSLEFARRGFFDKQRAASVERVNYGDFCIFVSPDDLAVGRYVKNKTYEPHITMLFKRLIKPGMAVLDIGANIGFLTMLAGSLVGNTGYVLAVEPNPDNARMIEASRKLNHFYHATVLQVAAGHALGILTLNASHSNGTTAPISDDVGGILGAITVPMIPLDMVVPADRHIDFIKVDVEGAEPSALAGLVQTIKEHNPLIVSEFSPDQMPGISGCSGPEYLKFLIDLGYKLSTIDFDGSIVIHDASTATVMEAYLRAGVDHIDILATPS